MVIDIDDVLLSSNIQARIFETQVNNNLEDARLLMHNNYEAFKNVISTPMDQNLCEKFNDKFISFYTQGDIPLLTDLLAFADLSETVTRVTCQKTVAAYISCTLLLSCYNKFVEEDYFKKLLNKVLATQHLKHAFNQSVGFIKKIYRHITLYAGMFTIAYCNNKAVITNNHLIKENAKIMYDNAVEIYVPKGVYGEALKKTNSVIGTISYSVGSMIGTVTKGFYFGLIKPVIDGYISLKKEEK